MNKAIEDFQITPEQAQSYEDRFVPGIFAEWAPRLVALARRRGGGLGAGVVGKQPAYGTLTEVVARHAGEDGASLMAT